MFERFGRSSLAVILTVVFVCSQLTNGLAGTTGGLSGVVTDAVTHAPLTDATVTVASPSQTGITHTDATGKFAFLS
ncbi:MAG: hypothetical protein ABI182_00030, partial [Candidatus Baltobacteraceae bacterium]